MATQLGPIPGSNSNTSRPLRRANTGSALLDCISDTSIVPGARRQPVRSVHPAGVRRRCSATLVRASRHGADQRGPTERSTWRSPKSGRSADEDAWVDSIIASFDDADAAALEAGRIRARRQHEDARHRARRVHGARRPAARTCGTASSPSRQTYRAWVRFSGPGPYVTPDIEDVGLHEHQHQADGRAGAEADGGGAVHAGLAGVSTPTFVTPDTKANAQLQKREPEERADLPLPEPAPAAPRSTSSCRACGSRRRAVRSKRRTSAACRTCWARGRRCSTRSGRHRRQRTPIPRLPLRPPDDYLRDAMVAALAQRRRRARLPRAACRPIRISCRSRTTACSGPSGCRPRVGGDAAAPAAALRFAGADRVRQAPVVQPVALHSRASPARQPEPGAPPDVLRAVASSGTA